MTVVLQGQTFSSGSWGEATVGAGNTATVTEQFSYAVALSGALTSGDTFSLVEQNAAHSTVTLTCTGLGSSSTFVLQDSASNDFLFSNTPIEIGDQATVSTSGLQLYEVPCFAQGTRILTRAGEVAVEALRVGDAVVTASGRLRPIAWIGNRSVDLRRHPRPQDVLPVCVQADAIAPRSPRRDLLLSPDHALFVDGLLIPVRYLRNGATIRQDVRSKVTYFHIELDRHDILLAEGLPVESYLDSGNRGGFANAAGVVTAHADFARGIWAARGCAPLVLEGTKLWVAKQRLLDRAALLGYAQSDDPAPRLWVDGAILWPQRAGDIYRFELPVPVSSMRLLSRTAVPAEMRAMSDDWRRLGIAVAQLAVNGQIVQPGDVSRSAGWHAPEAEWQWTDGNATLLWPGAREVSLRVRRLVRYWQVPVNAQPTIDLLGAVNAPQQAEKMSARRPRAAAR